MSLVENLVSIDKELPVPVYLQITNSIINLIRSGTIKPESALPGSRALAQALNVHRKTVIAAYDELYAQSWVDVLPRKRMFVARNLPDIKPKPLAEQNDNKFASSTFFEVENRFDSLSDFVKPAPLQNLVFNDGFPDTRLAPVELLVREYRRFGNYKFTSKYLSYGSPQGSENLRIELAKFFGETRGLHVGPESILITKGVQMALYLTSQVLIKKGDTVLAPDPGYPVANITFEQAGARVELVPVDDHGIDLNVVEDVCKKRKVRLLYAIPHHHRPTSVTLSAERRMKLLELANKYRFAIVEDDYDYDFRYTSSPILPLASADYYGSVIYVGSFCKTIAPGIRIGFAVAPTNLIGQLTALRCMIDRQGEQLLEEAMANLLKNGDIGRHLKKTNKIYHERRDHLSTLLKEHLPNDIAFKTPDGGFAIWAQYLNGIRPERVAEKAAEMGLTVSNGSGYYDDEKYQSSCIRLGFASLDLQEMEEGVELLKKAVDKTQ